MTLEHLCSISVIESLLLIIQDNLELSWIFLLSKLLLDALVLSSLSDSSSDSSSSDSLSEESDSSEVLFFSCLWKTPSFTIQRFIPLLLQFAYLSLIYFKVRFATFLLEVSFLCVKTRIQETLSVERRLTFSRTL